MTDLELFYQLKEKVLERYKESNPYFNGNWKNFSSQDILQLIDEIQIQTKSTVSEKWIYTHLKPETNVKLPRKDMLDILSSYANEKSWDAFKFNAINTLETLPQSNKQKSKWKLSYLLYSVLFLLFIGILYFKIKKPNQTSIVLKNSFTNDSVSKQEVKAYIIEDSIEKPVDLEKEEITNEKPIKVLIKSPFYQSKKIVLEPNLAVNTIELKPNDYAMVLKAFLKSDIKDWQIRKQQLKKILSDNLEVIVMLPNNLGAEYLNKEEFAQKLIIPSPSLKKMSIIEVENDENDRIKFIRIIQD
ncbi:Probable transmembrane protein of unknown function [Flavobacterium indicum GPTSA100-9 = DSM 17447]|uniref:Uncharacterized protein n=1 Tax=Flavobacterium indicum (strain DSM 17447 / CIP 109464 / GPTSA100-9) TaxID=1094466 RepID=H8XU01_FLAIG|nr:hypothetical protein [Flavobacterium indicum]CCG53731.1 Probable transmembrane protein of unknown function [Flavobacterium indicum GPTSA100-9 = DSM 17447]